MEDEIECIDCGWTGDSTMLESKTESLFDLDFNYCPDCSGNNIEDREPEENIEE